VESRSNLAESLAGGRLFSLVASPDKDKSQEGGHVMRDRNVKYVLIAVVLLALSFGVGRLSAAGPMLAGGTLDSPGPPGTTLSYTLEDIYNRLYDGTGGVRSAFTEPAAGPTVGTGHTLDEVMAKAPAVDDTSGAIQADVLADRKVWGLTGGEWGLITGTMANNGAVTMVPTTISQTIAAGYHNGSGYVEGDADLVAGNIRSGVSIFGVNGAYVGGPAYPAQVPRTGQTVCYSASGTEISCTGTGQDGEYQNGIAWPSPRFITSTTGVVTDTLTGLVWLQDAGCLGAQTWANALTSANSLYDGWTGDGSGGDCGLSDGSSAGDWRLPNVRELQSLVDYGRDTPAVPDGHPFASISSSYYWSSTTFARITSNAWGVHLGDGNVDRGDKAGTDYVWPVRGGQ
jgi:hypothetical protein